MSGDLAVSKFTLDEDKVEKAPVLKGVFGGQDEPDDNSKLIKRVTEQELERVEAHLLIVDLIKELNEKNKSEKAKNKTISNLKKSVAISREIMNEILVDMKSGNKRITVESLRKLEELCT